MAEDSDGSTDSDALEEFSDMRGPTLIEQIRTILDEYPDDGQIIKELVQNADDAGAVNMKIMYDGRTIDNPENPASKYSKFVQTPAMVFYNDGEFTDKDWEGIKMIYSSVKVDDPLKIGRFGLGFKSVFHITDYPCIISGENILFLNPHEREGRKVCVTVKLSNLRNTKLNFADCIDVLMGTFGFSEETINSGKFSGTLLWFPLRKIQSKLSDNIYNKSKVEDLFRAFMSDSRTSLLFLKSLQSVTLSAKLPDKLCGDVPLSPTQEPDVWSFETINHAQLSDFYSVVVDNEEHDLLKKKRQFMKKLEQEINSKTETNEICDIYDVSVTTRLKQIGFDDTESKSRWLIINYLKGGEISDTLRDLINDKSLGYQPIVGIATKIPDVPNHKPTGGHLFCFQPLPQESHSLTGLPVHLNGFFALSQNRRHVKWPSADQEKHSMHTDKAIQWNSALVSEVLPIAYVKLFKAMITVSEKVNNPANITTAINNTIPDHKIVDDRWKVLADTFIRRIAELDILFTENEGGKWVPIDDAIVSLQIDLHDKSTIIPRQTVVDLLMKDCVDIVLVPDHILEALKLTGKNVNFLSADWLVTHLNENETYKTLTQKEKENLLQFMTADGNYDKLEGLELLPLQNGEYAAFDDELETVYIDSEEVTHLFPGEERHFVATTISTQVFDALEKIASKGQYQIQKLDCDAVVHLTKCTLLNKFGPYTCKIDVQQSDEAKLWLEKYWRYLDDQFPKDIQQDQHFIDLPIFPVTQNIKWNAVKGFSLYPLTGLLLQKKHKESQLSNVVCKSFELLDVTIVQTTPEWINKELIHTFLYNGTSDSIEELFERINEEVVDIFNDQSTDKQREAFVLFLSNKVSSDLLPKTKSLLARLSLFKQYIATDSESQWVSIEDNNLIYDESDFPVRFMEPKLRTQSASENELAKRLGGKIFSHSQVIMETLERIDDYDKDEVATFMYWYLDKRIYNSMPDTKQFVTNISFIETANNKLQRPCDILDPSDKLLKTIFQSENLFPVDEKLCTEDNIIALRALGLRLRRDVTSEEIERTCKLMHASSLNENEITDVSKASAFLDLLEELGQDMLRNISISDMNFVVVDDEVPETYPLKMRFYNKHHDRRLYSPSELKSDRHIQLIGGVSPVVDCKPFPIIAEHFSWLLPPGVEIVVKQLAMVTESYSQSMKSAVLPMITNIYRWLSTQQSKEHVKELLQATCKPLTIWMGEGFSDIGNVVAELKSGDIDMKPFIYVLPAELMEYKDFIIQLGCLKSVELSTYLNVLKHIHATCDSLELPMPVSAARQMVISILTKLKESFSSELHEINETVYVPIHTCDEDILVMKPAAKCTYCDAQWLKDVDFTDDDDEILYIHGDVSNSTAEALGVPSLTQQILSDAEAFEEWGQKEPLTRRLHCLLKEGYVDGFSVPKELFQNADDAGASKLWILYDERENNDAKSQLLSEGMSDCQGPAIWAYNDAKFTDDDLKNITKLSGATKEDDSSKIGKFGLGFCSVYNVTDVPSFISGENVVIFDPHTTHLGNALPGKSPGLKLNLRKMKRLKMMRKVSNQFRPFENIFGCNIMKEASPYFEGTLFRLPLRRKISEISDTIYTETEVKKLMGKIFESSANMLLFNQNVKEVKIYHLTKDGNPSNLTLLYDIQKTVSRLLDFNTSILKETAHRKKQKTLDNPLKVIQEVTISTNLLPEKSAFLSDMKRQKGKTNWIVSWATGQSKRLLDLTFSEPGALPLAAVAVPTTETTISTFCTTPMTDLPSTFYKDGHFFYFLPLPIIHPFPFHINCQFAVTADRRQLRATTEDDKNTKMKEWNEGLLEDAVVLALLQMLENIGTRTISKDYHFFELWPQPNKIQLEERVPDMFYKVIMDPAKAFNVFESQGKWYDVSKCMFLHPKLRQLRMIGNIALYVLQKTESKFAIVDIPELYFNQLRNANEEVMDEKTIDIVKFFLEYFFLNIDTFSGSEDDLKHRNSLLHYAVSLNNEQMDEWLQKNACIPTKPKNKLCIPSIVILEDTQIAKMFEESEGYFPVNTFKDVPYQRMKHLGVLHDVLPANLVEERVKTVKKRNEKCTKCALDRCSLVVDYLCSKQSIIDSNHMMLISKISFLPVLERPRDWPFVWEADTIISNGKVKSCKMHRKDNKKRCTIEKPEQLYDQRSRNLVGSLFPMLDESEFTGINFTELRTLKKALGVKGVEKKDIPVTVLMEQIITAAEQFHPTKTISNLDVSNVVNDTYRHLDRCCTNDEDNKKMAETVLNKSIIWCSGSFQNATDVSFNQECQPFLFKVDESLQRDCKRLCKELDIHEYFRSERIAVELQCWHTQSKNQPLNDLKLCNVFNLVRMLFENMKCENISLDDLLAIEGIEAVFAPDKHNVLQMSTDMCFDDYVDLKSNDTMIFVHESISKDVAKAFGVKAKLVQSLEESSEDIEDFYQDEPLVTRLNGLLNGYPCDSGIFKELLQNADDAGATEVHFLNDTSTHSSNKILDDCFKPLQGPALVVYNNSPFTQDDLRGIQSLGKGSKRDDPSKTGQYGVGFNACYNLTDAPSFLTKGDEIENGATLCMFDPMAKYLPGLKRAKPGKRYKNIDSLKQTVNDMLSGYHEDRFLKTCEGTVFRFPLRTKEMAENSEIKTEEVNCTLLTRMLDQFQSELSEMLLFLKNIKVVKLSTYQGTTFIENFCIKVRLSHTDSLKRQQYFDNHKALCKQLKGDRMSSFRCRPSTEDYEMKLTITPKNVKRYLIVQRIGYDDGSLVPELVKEHVMEKKIGLLPQGGVALLLSDTTDKSTTTNKLKYFDGSKAFCFLPLPIETGLPVHVHGHFALDHETRRTLWKSDQESTCARTQWNLSLIENVIVPAYIVLLERMKHTLLGKYENTKTPSHELNEYLDLFRRHFPVESCVREFYWEHLTLSLYRCLVSKNVQFLHVMERHVEKSNIDCLSKSGNISPTVLTVLSWTSLKIDNFKFPAYHSEESNADLKDERSFFNTVLRNIGLRVVFVPEKIRSSMKSAGVEVKTISPTLVMEFLISHAEDIVDKCNIFPESLLNETTWRLVENVRLVLIFCLKEEKTFFKLMERLPLLVTQDNIVRCFQPNKTVFVTQFNRFFLQELHSFIHSNLVPELFSLLEKTGQSVMKRFTMQDFVNLLQRWMSQVGIKKSTSITNWDMKTPSRVWMTDMWKFFWSEISSENNVHDAFTRISSYSLLPVVECNDTKRNHLLPVEELPTLIDLPTFENSSVFLQTALRKMCRYQLLRNCFKEATASKMLTEVPNFKSPQKLLRCLTLNVNKGFSIVMSDCEATSILDYITDNLLRIRMENTECKTEIIQLPIFITHYGKQIHLKTCKRIFIVPIKMPQDGLQGLSDDMQTVLLKKDIVKQEMINVLGVKEADIADIYIDVIFTKQREMERVSFYSHVKYIANVCSKQQAETQSKSRLLQALTCLPFIKDTNGYFRRVNEMFDPRCVVFKEMCKPFELLPSCLCDHEYFGLFQQLGLIQDMTLPLFERFAKQISNMDLQCQELLSQGTNLVKALMGMKESFFQQNNFERFVKIPFFIPKEADKWHKEICPQQNSNTLVSFHGAVIGDEINTCWSTANVLPKWANPQTHLHGKKKEIVKEKLHIKSRPEFDKFVGHCSNVGKSLNEKIKGTSLSTTTKIMAGQIFNSIYKAFQMFKEKEIIDMQQLATLKPVPMVYFVEECSISLATDIIIHCKDNEQIPPYLRQPPVSLEIYSDILLLLGASKEPNACVYAHLLSRLKKECGDHELLPPDLLKAVKSTKLMFDTIATSTETVNLQVETLFLPSIGIKLENSKCIVVNDNMYFKRRLGKNANPNYFCGFEILEIKDFHGKQHMYIEYFKKLPEKHRPAMLTEIVEERIDLNRSSENRLTLAKELMDFLHSKVFINGFLRLVKHVRRLEARDFSTAIETSYESKVKQIKVTSVTNITTILTLQTYENGKFGNATDVENTEDKKSLHIEENKSGTCVYVDANQSDWLSDTMEGLARYLNRCVESCLKEENLFTLVKILKKNKKPEDIQNLLDKEKIDPYQMAVEDDAPILPKPGVFVPVKFHPFLDNGYGVIYEYDYECMAYEKEDPVLLDEIEDGDNEATYVFCVIIRKVGPDCEIPLFQKYEVDIGEDKYVIVSAANLFKFSRDKANPSSVANDLALVLVSSDSIGEEENEETSSTKSQESESPPPLLNDMKKVLKEIRTMLNEAWKIKEDKQTQKQIVKRLQLKWHPDKNPKNVQFCTKVFQHIQNYVRRLAKGETLPEEEDHDNNNAPDGGKRSGSQGDRSYPSDPDWDTFWERTGRRSDKHRQRYKEYEREWNSGWRGSFSGFNYRYQEEEKKPYHYYEEAKRWQKQAKSDYRNAKASLDELSDPSFNWICFKCHQAAEKSLKAGWYAEDANKITRVRNSKDLNFIASGLIPELSDLARRLVRLTGNHDKMLYPNHHTGLQIPANCYAVHDAKQACDLTEQILTKVSSTYSC